MVVFIFVLMIQCISFIKHHIENKEYFVANLMMKLFCSRLRISLVWPPASMGLINLDNFLSNYKTYRVSYPTVMLGSQAWFSKLAVG